MEPHNFLDVKLSYLFSCNVSSRGDNMNHVHHSTNDQQDVIKPFDFGVWAREIHPDALPRPAGNGHGMYPVRWPFPRGLGYLTGPARLAKVLYIFGYERPPEPTPDIF